MKSYTKALCTAISAMLLASCTAINQTAGEISKSTSNTAQTENQTQQSTTSAATATQMQTTAATVTTVVTTAAKTVATTTVATTTTAPSIPIKESYNGIDVSRWQGTVDFESVRQSGVEMVYIKAGDNYQTDICFEQNAENAENAGLLKGFYFYVTAGNVSEATAQAEYFAQLLSQKEFECRPAVDFEAFGNLSVESINAIALEFAQTVEEETGITPIFYTDADNADIWCEELTKYPLWIADYDANPPASIGKWQAYSGFQYSCTGVVEGITENVVDLDIFTSDVLIAQ